MFYVRIKKTTRSSKSSEPLAVLFNYLLVLSGLPFFARKPCGPACNAMRSIAGRLPQGASLSLRQSLELTKKKYGANRANCYHLLKSLTYFDDAEREPMPQMLRPVDWDVCKRFFIQAAQDVIL